VASGNTGGTASNKVNMICRASGGQQRDFLSRAYGARTFAIDRPTRNLKLAGENNPDDGFCDPARAVRSQLIQ
jgi:hypothetical protein